MRPLLLLLPVEEATRIRIQLPDILKHCPHAIDRPRVRVQIVLHCHLFERNRRNVINSRHRRAQPIHIVNREPHLYARLLTTRLFARPPRKRADNVRAPLRKNRLDRPAESRSIRQQQHNRRNPPRHPDHRDSRAAAVIQHRLPSLPKYVFQHRITPALTNSANTRSPTNSLVPSSPCYLVPLFPGPSSSCPLPFTPS